MVGTLQCVSITHYLPDLDGDFYWGTWDPAILPEREEEPLRYGDYRHPADVREDPFPSNHKRDFTRVAEMRASFSDFAIMNDLGVISNRRYLNSLLLDDAYLCLLDLQLQTGMAPHVSKPLR